MNWNGGNEVACNLFQGCCLPCLTTRHQLFSVLITEAEVECKYSIGKSAQLSLVAYFRLSPCLNNNCLSDRGRVSEWAPIGRHGMVLGNRDHCNFYSGFTLLPSVWRAALLLASFLNGQHLECHFAQPAVRSSRGATSEAQAMWGDTGSVITMLGVKVQASQPVDVGHPAAHLLQAAPGCQTSIETWPVLTLNNNDKVCTVCDSFGYHNKQHLFP